MFGQMFPQHFHSWIEKEVELLIIDESNHHEDIHSSNEDNVTKRVTYTVCQNNDNLAILEDETVRLTRNDATVAGDGSYGIVPENKTISDNNGNVNYNTHITGNKTNTDSKNKIYSNNDNNNNNASIEGMMLAGCRITTKSSKQKKRMKPVLMTVRTTHSSDSGTSKVVGNINSVADDAGHHHHQGSHKDIIDIRQELKARTLVNTTITASIDDATMDATATAGTVTTDINHKNNKSTTTATASIINNNSAITSTPSPIIPSSLLCTSNNHLNLAGNESTSHHHRPSSVYRHNSNADMESNRDMVARAGRIYVTLLMQQHLPITYALKLLQLIASCPIDDDGQSTDTDGWHDDGSNSYDSKTSQVNENKENLDNGHILLGKDVSLTLYNSTIDRDSQLSSVKNMSNYLFTHVNHLHTLLSSILPIAMDVLQSTGPIIIQTIIESTIIATWFPEINHTLRAKLNDYNIAMPTVTLSSLSNVGSHSSNDLHFKLPESFLKPFREEVDSRHEFRTQVADIC
jgi:hypothetical protein